MKKLSVALLCCAIAVLAISCNKEKDVPVTSVSLSQPTAEMIIGETVQLSATVLPSDATDKSVTWASSKQSVATVTSSGKVTAVAEGVSTITASAGGKSANCTVTVSKGYVAVTSVTLNKTELALEKGKTETLTATVAPDDATDKTVTWSSSASSIVSVDNNGKVTALAGGSAVITAKAGDKQATCTVTVTVHVESITLDRESVTLEEKSSITLVATVKPDDATDKTVTWSSSNNEIATVDEAGKVTAIKEGEATITAKAEEKTATCKVTVNKKFIAVTSVTLNKGELALEKGQSESLVATVAPEDATDKTVTWTTSDEKVATVDNAGKVSAVAGGSAIITAKAGEKETTCAVTVTVPVTSVSLDQYSLTLEEKQNATLTATVLPDDATDKTVEWSSSNDAVAKVEKGVVSAIKEGTATITAKAGGKEAKCEVTVKKVASKAKLTLAVEAGKLKETIEALGIDILNVQELTVSGELNGNDLAVIRTMAGNDKYFIQEDNTPSAGCLEVLDMKGSVLIPGSEVYMYQYGQNYSINNYNEIPHDAFRACIRLKRVVLPDKCTLASGFSFFACYDLKSVDLPASVTTIPRNCFSACRSLEQVSLPNVTKINEYAFNGCVSLTSVELGSIQKFGSDVFERCTALTSISIPDTNQYFCIENKAVLSKDKTILYYYPGGLSGSYTTPSTVEQIAPWAFCDTNLDALNVAYGVRVIGDYAFYNSNFESLTIANSVTDIGVGWFNNPRLNHLELPGSVKVLLAEIQNCPALKEVVIPDGMTDIVYAFGNCPNLQKITLPESLTRIDKRSFGGTAIKEVHCKSSTPTKYDKYPFASDAIVYVPKGAKDAYIADNNWNVYTIVEE